MGRRDDVATWDANASRYAGQEALEHAVIATVLRLAAPRRGENLLDVATGTGILLRTLARRPSDDRPAVAVGVDASAGMLGEVGQLPDGWEVQQADARALPIDDASVDVVTCAYLLHLLDAADRGVVVRELARVVRPGGRVVVATPWSPRGAVRALLRATAAIAPARLGGLTPLDPGPDLRAAGLVPRTRVVLPRSGYPSVVVLADPE